MLNFLRRLLVGRYGSDQLNHAFLLLGIVLCLVEWVTRWQWLSFAILLLLGLCYFRMFSRNISARYRENQRFLQWWQPIRNQIENASIRFRDRKTHRFFKCPSCRKRLRVPRGRGTIQITCPNCRHQFTRKS